MEQTLAKQAKLDQMFTEKEQQKRSLNKLKMLQTPISKWKYIGVLEWGHNHSSTTDFFLAELELVIVSGLEMYPIYAKLEKIVLAMESGKFINKNDDKAIH